jgi:hypothetical protein
MEQPKMSIQVRATVKAVADAKEGSLVTFRAIGPGERLDRDDPTKGTAPMWLAVKCSGKRSCAATVGRVRKGDWVDVLGNLVMGSPWTTQQGEVRQDLVLWVDELWIHGEEVAAPDAAPDATSYDDSSIPF